MPRVSSECILCAFPPKELGDDDEESKNDEESDDEETREEESFDLIPRTPKDSENDGNGEEDQGLSISEYGVHFWDCFIFSSSSTYTYTDIDINQGRGLQVSQDIEDSHMTLTPVHPDGQQESSSVSSQFMTSMLNPTSDVGMESIFRTASSLVAPLPTPTPTMTPSIITTITTASHPPIPPTPIPSEVLQNLPTFDSVFCFDEKLKSLEANFSEYRQTNPFVEAVSNIRGIVHQYMNQQMTEAVRMAVQIQTDRLRDSYQRENDEFLRTIDENMKRIIKEQVKIQVKEQVLRILPRIEESVNAQLEAEVLIRSSNLSRTSYAVAADLLEMQLKKILIEKIKGNKETAILKRRREDDDDQEGPSAGSDLRSKRQREGGEPESASAPLVPTTKSAGRSITGSKSRQASASESAFAEEPVQTTSQIEEPLHPVFETEKSEKLGRVSTEMELILEHSQQGISYEVSETLKRRRRFLIPAKSQSHNRMLIPDYQDIIFQDFRYSDGFECYQVIKIGRLVPSCCVIFDLEPLSSSLTLSLILRSLNLSPRDLFHLAILCLDQQAHTMHHLESLLTISHDNLCLDNLDIFKEDLEYQNEPFEEMGSEAVVVPAHKEEEFATITMLGEHVSFPNGIALSFVLMQVPTVFPLEIHLRTTKVKILPVGFHVRPDLGGVVFTYTSEVLFGEKFCPVEIHLLGILGKAWYLRMKILRSVLFRKERMVGPKENKVKVAEKEETGKFCGSPDGGPEEMELESTQTSTTAKLPMLNQAETTTNDAGTSTIRIPSPVTNEEKYKDAKTLFAAIETRFGRNEATKKTQKTLLKIFPSEWNTHVVVWRNKSDLDTMSLDDLYNNFKIVEQEVRGTTSTNTSSQNMAFVSSPSPNSTNESTTDFGVSIASSQVSTANLSDAMVYAFMDNQPNGSQLVHEDLEQIYEDDLEEMDLKWQLALLSMRAKRFFQKTGKKITINGSDTVGYDKAKELRNQRRIVNVEETSSKAMVKIDEAGFDCYMADDKAPTNMAFMALSDSEYDELRVEFNKSKCNLADYKRGLASVEEQLVHYKTNESLLNENIVVLERDILIKDTEIAILKSKLEKISKEKDVLETKIEKFKIASQRLDKLIGSQITDNSKRGLGYVSYNVVPPPYTGRFSPLRIDLSHTGLLEFAEPSDSKSEGEDEVESPPKVERKTVEPSIDKVEVGIPKQNDKSARRPVKYAEMYITQRPRGNPRNWNNLKLNQL
nr:hypothetical protein [Tanacetum cinerariifolium]